MRVPWLLLVVVLAAVALFAYRWYVGFTADDVALAKLRLLRLHGKAFLSAGPAS